MQLFKVIERVWKPLAIILGIYLFSVAGFVYATGYSWTTGLYWGITTLSTVGYGDVVPTNGLSRVFASVLMLSTIGVVGYLVSTVTMLSLQIKEEELLGSEGAHMKDHVVMLGWGPSAKAALIELLLAGERVAIMTSRQDQLTEIRSFVSGYVKDARTNPLLRDRISSEDDVFVAFGNYSEHSSLKLLNVEDASKAVVVSDDDTRNMMTSLILKGMAPKLRIVVVLTHEQLKETLQAAGITYVISPSEMGGRILSAACTQPEVALSYDDLTTSSRGATMNEYEVHAGSPLKGMDFRSASEKLLADTGTILVGVARLARRPEGYYFDVKIDPPFSERLEEKSYVIVITSLQNNPKLDHYMGIKPGRVPHQQAR